MAMSHPREAEEALLESIDIHKNVAPSENPGLCAGKICLF